MSDKKMNDLATDPATGAAFFRDGLWYIFRAEDHGSEVINPRNARERAAKNEKRSREYGRRLGTLLRQVRTASRLTPERLGSLCGRSTDEILLIERGDRLDDLWRLESLSDAYGSRYVTAVDVLTSDGAANGQFAKRLRQLRGRRDLGEIAVIAEVPPEKLAALERRRHWQVLAAAREIVAALDTIAPRNHRYYDLAAEIWNQAVG